MKKKQNHWSWLLILTVSLIISACDKGENETENSTASETAPVEATAIEKETLKAIKVSTAYFNSFVLMNNGTVRGWGQAQHGQLGSDILKPYGDTKNDASTPVQIAIEGVVALEASHSATGNAGNTVCVQKNDGNVWCWGDGGLIPLEGQADSSKPMEVPPLKGAKKIALGLGHGCALMAEATVQCWGGNYNGQLGNGDNKTSAIPVNVPELADVVDLAVGTSHSCVALKTGDVKCWGKNGSRQIILAKGSPDKIKTPTLVEGISGAVAVMASDDESCALDQSGALKCWGNRRDAIVHMANDVIQVSGFNDHMCLRKKDNTVHCWGNNSKGELGQGSTTEPYNSKTPLQVKEIADAVDISVAYSHSCAVIKDGSVKCWGVNEFGELGDGTHVNRSTPVLVKELNAEPLPEVSTGFGDENLPTVGVEQKWENLPAECTYTETFDVKHTVYHREAFKVISANAKISSEGYITLRIANFKLHNDKGWVIYNPRGDQATLLVYLSRVDDSKAEKPKKEAVDVGKYVFEKNDPASTRTVSGSLVNSHTTYSFKDGVTPESHINITHVGEDWVCGTMDIANEKGHAKGTFVAKVQK